MIVRHFSSLLLVFVLGLATSVHLTMRFRWHRGAGSAAPEAAVAAVRDRGWAIFWAGITTAVAFGSFAASRVPPAIIRGFQDKVVFSLQF